MRIVAFIVTGVLVASTIGCAHDIRPAQAPSGATAGVVLSTASGTGAGSVTLSADLRRVCAIEDLGAVPKFSFDSNILSTTDRSELDQVARCMTSGPLAGKNVELVGRADPRGDAEYNMGIGAHRAAAVEHYLGQLGIAESRLPTTSRGALDATGHDEATWAVDRRVDLRIAGR